MECDYLYMPYIPAFGAEVHKGITINVIDNLVQDNRSSSVLAMELLHCYTEPLIQNLRLHQVC